MIIYTFNSEKLEVKLTGQATDADKLKSIKSDLEATDLRYSSNPPSHTPAFLASDIETSVDTVGNMSLLIKCKDDKGLSQVLFLLTNDFDASFYNYQKNYGTIGKPEEAKREAELSNVDNVQQKLDVTASKTDPLMLSQKLSPTPTGEKTKQPQVSSTIKIPANK